MLSKPLIKVLAVKQGGSTIPAIQNGQRFALVGCGHSIYRIKGCGYLDEGFALFPHESKNKSNRLVTVN